jgi:hypothetical protein
MKQTYYKVYMYHGGESVDEIRRTKDIDQARQWVTECEHGVIENQNGIAVQ